MLSRPELEEIARVAVEHDLLVVCDEVYRTLIYDGVPSASIAECPGMKERTLVVNSVSKAFAMTGWRVGFAMGPRKADRQDDPAAGVPERLRRHPLPVRRAVGGRAFRGGGRHA